MPRFMLEAVRDPVQSFVLPSYRPYTMHELRSQHVSIG